MKLQTLQDMPDLQGKKVIVRVDFNVPLDESGDIRNDVRIQFAVPTLQYLLSKGVAQLILMTHVGRPKNNEPELKTDKIAQRLGEFLEETVKKIDDWGEKGLPQAKVVMLENLRFHPGEKSKEEAERDSFGAQLAGLADFYVNEAFSNSHRSHASMTGVPALIPGFAGFGVQKEMEVIGEALENPKHPVVAVIAGAKADKLSAIGNMLQLADAVMIGGALAFALRGRQGYSIGSSLIDTEGMAEMADVVEKITASQKVLLPKDAVVATEFSETAEHKVVPIDGIEAGWMALDIGPETTQEYVEKIKEAKTILWFGPVGVFEMEPYSHGTEAVAHAMAENPGTTIVGGGDSATAVKKFNVESEMTHVSTGGGASLRMIEGKPLPAIEILKR